MSSLKTSISQDEMVALIEQVAEHLSGQWTVDPFPGDWGRGGAWLREDRTGAILSIGESQIWADRHKNLLAIGTDYPKERDGQSSMQRRPRISVSASKSAQTIARDIERRLLPEYLPLLEKEISSTKARQSFEDKTTKIAKQIADLVHVKHKSRETSVDFYHSPYKIFQETMSRAEVVSEDAVEITLRVGSREALMLLNQIINGRFEMP